MEGRQTKHAIQCLHILLLCLGMILVIVPNASAQTSELLGTYQFTMYVSDIEGPFIGTCTMELIETTESINTSFGIFSNIVKKTQSDLKLEHETHGYIEILNSTSYFDSNSFLRKSEQKVRLRVSGYEDAYLSQVYELGHYLVVRDTETVYEEHYVQRYYEYGFLEEQVDCIDLTILEDPLNVTVPAGTFECISLKTYHYEDEVIQSYSVAWIDSEGNLIQQDQYDTDDSLTTSIVLLSEPGFILGLQDVGLIAGYSLLLLGVGVIIYIVRRKKPHSNKQRFGLEDQPSGPPVIMFF